MSIQESTQEEEVHGLPLPLELEIVSYAPIEKFSTC
jgi:hypothetical protein